MKLTDLKTTYEPTEADIQWTEDFLSSWISPGIFWVSPTGVYQVNKTEKIITLVKTHEDGKETVARVFKVAEIIGWTVKINEDIEMPEGFTVKVVKTTEINEEIEIPEDFTVKIVKTT